MQLQAALVKISIGITLSMAVTVSHAYISCEDVDYENNDYHSNMEKLATQARLPDNYYNRYHQSAVSDLCNGDEESLEDAIDYGYVKRSEVESLRESLGLDKRSNVGGSYQYSRQTFNRLGLSSSASDNIAQFYTKEIDSQCGQLAKRALEGNPRAIEELHASPGYCIWNYD
jgi:hypothetical protein